MKLFLALLTLFFYKIKSFKYQKKEYLQCPCTNKMSFIVGFTLTFACIEMEFPTQFRMFGFSEIMRFSAQRKAEETGWWAYRLISRRIKPGFVSCPRARISWMIVLVSIWVLIILLWREGTDGQTDGRKNLGSESRVANNCCGVESAFCNPTEVSIESFRYFHSIYSFSILNFQERI